MSSLKRSKAAGVDGIPGEMNKILEENAKTEMLKLSNTIHEEEEWPDDFTPSNMIPLEKKTKTNKCEGHRTISLISHSSKIPLKALGNRLMTRRISEEISSVSCKAKEQEMPPQYYESLWKIYRLR